VRSKATLWDHDRYFAPDITAIRSLVESGAFQASFPVF
jgi:histidine ammonia-lyase